MAKTKRAVLLDRDGVINRLITERGSRETPTTPEELELLPGAPEALARLKQAGYVLVIVTNQPNVAKGKSTYEQHAAIEERLRSLVGVETLEAIYTCLHHPDPTQVVRRELLAKCDCRKPKPGLILQAQRELGLNLGESWLIGDSETDIIAGQAAGIPTDRLIFIGQVSTLTHVVAPSLLEATLYIETKETQ